MIEGVDIGGGLGRRAGRLVHPTILLTGTAQVEYPRAGAAASLLVFIRPTQAMIRRTMASPPAVLFALASGLATPFVTVCQRRDVRRWPVIWSRFIATCR
ncbi:hypothetical protein Acsp02_70950 [Actinoplanes sp. NBRC 103695]|nr:hypothetical protein Acsp02_70950 [Actinoplanes sp. NBRC 103695]